MFITIGPIEKRLQPVRTIGFFCTVIVLKIFNLSHLLLDLAPSVVRFIFVNFGTFHPIFQDLPAYFRENGEVAEFPGAMAAQSGGGWAPNLVERLMSSGQTRGRRAGLENVWRSGDPYLQCNVRLIYTVSAT